MHADMKNFDLYSKDDDLAQEIKEMCREFTGHIDKTGHAIGRVYKDGQLVMVAEKKRLEDFR